MYDYFQRLWANREKIITVGIIVAFLLLAVCWFSYCIGLRNAGTTDGDGGSGGAEQVGQHIQSAVTGQREITERIDGLQNSSDKISGGIEAGAAGIEAAAAANSNAESLVRESGELIAEGQRILQTIRRRAKKDSASH